MKQLKARYTILENQTQDIEINLFLSKNIILSEVLSAILESLKILGFFKNSGR